MPAMEITQGVFTFIVSLAAVINGLGIVRIVAGVGDYFRRRESLEVNHYWVYSLVALFQLLAHVMIWWAMLGLRDVGSINFLQYLYLLLGPTLLFLATSLLIPDVTDNKVDLHAEYGRLRKPYYTLLAIFWVWTMAIWPVFGYPMAPTWKFAACWLVIMSILRLTENAKVHAVLVSATWLLLFAYIGIYAMQLGGVARMMVQ
jgi:hypothetical protein